MPPVIEVRQLKVQFNGETVLDDFSLTVEPGQKVTISGRSGSGKSTILRCILGFVTPHSGEVFIEGDPLSGKNVWNLRRKMAYVAQEPQLGEGTAEEILKMPFRYRANAQLKHNLDKLPDYMVQFGLQKKLLQEDVADISGGEKQRIAIISALTLDRRIFLLDEATSALDPESREIVIKYFCGRDDLTVLAVSHEQDLTCFSDQVIRLSSLAAGVGP